MTNEELQALVEQQAAIIAQQADAIASIHARLPPVEEPPLEPGAYREFPRILYREGGHEKQVDHPGNEVLKVHNQVELDAAIEDGWSKDPIVPTPKKTGKK